MATKQIRTVLQVDQDREYNRKIKLAEKSLDNFAKGATGLGQNLRMFGPHAAIAVAGVMAVGAAAQAVAQSVQAATRAVIDLGRRGGEVSPVAAAFERMAGPDLLARLERVAGYQVSQYDLMTATNQVLRTGIMSQDQWADAAERTVRAAQDLGRDIDTSVRSMATFASGGGIETLSQLGVNVLQIRTELRAMGLTAETTEGRMQAMNLALAQMSDDLGRVDNSSSNVGDSWNQVSAAIRNTYDEIARAFVENEALTRTFEILADVLRGTREDGQQWGDTIARIVVEVTGTLIDLLAALLPIPAGILSLVDAGIRLHQVLVAVGTLGISPLIRWLLGMPPPLEGVRRATLAARDGINAMRQVAVTAQGALSGLRSELALLNAEADRTAAITGEAEGIERATRGGRIRGEEAARLARERIAAAGNLGDLTEEQRAATAAAREWGEQQRRNRELQEAGNAAARESIVLSRKREEEANARRGGGGSGPSAAEEAAALLMERQIEAGNELKESRRQQIEEETERYELIMTYQMAIQAQEMQNLEEQARVQDEIKRAHEELMGTEMEQREEQILQEQLLKEAQQQRIVNAIQNTRSMASAVKQSFGAVIKAMEAAGASSEATQKAYGVLLIAYNSVMAATDLADSIRAFASQDYVKGAAMLVSMAAHIAAAAQAASELGGGSPKTPTGSFTAAPPRAEPQDRDTVSGGTVINNNYGFGQSNSDIGEAVTRHVARYDRVGGGMRGSAPAFSG